MDRCQEIERSIIKTYRAKLWSQFIKALKEYDMLKENDHICVCISGGKDSMLLAKLFQELKKHSDFNFDVTYLVMNPGYNEKNFDLIKKNLDILQIPATIIKSDIFEIAEILGGKPCYMCAKMRRGALYKFAKELGCNKIALGHHYDDVIETTLMSIINNGQLETMLPKLHSENYEGMELIRPLYLIRERDIINWCNRNELEFIRCACKLTEGVENLEMTSQRKETKKLIAELEKSNPIAIKNLFKVTSNVNLNKILGWKKGNKQYSFLDDYDKKDE
ncbi:MAG: hypothetical protein IJU60_03080 [Acholeplasmatales bacterium]|nr:hypothetical protein [Acholeplasmatales bacterium]